MKKCFEVEIFKFEMMSLFFMFDEYSGSSSTWNRIVSSFNLNVKCDFRGTFSDAVCIAPCCHALSLHLQHASIFLFVSLWAEVIFHMFQITWAKRLCFMFWTNTEDCGAHTGRWLGRISSVNTSASWSKQTKETINKLHNQSELCRWNGKRNKTKILLQIKLLTDFPKTEMTEQVLISSHKVYRQRLYLETEHTILGKPLNEEQTFLFRFSKA